MTKDILVSPTAQRQFEQLDRSLKDRIWKALKELSKQDLEQTGRLDIKKLRGIKNREDLYRLRVGDYRIIFFEDKTNIRIIQILHRNKAYEWL